MNPIRSILCHVDASAGCARRLAVAREIGDWAQADVTGLYATTSAFVAMPFAMAESSAAGQMALQLDLDRRERARVLFDGAMAQPGRPVRWAQLDDVAYPIYDMARRALYSDLLVLGQRDPASALEVPADFAESVIADSGKPAIVLPYAWDGQTVGTRVLVAWKEGRESARALQAALPFLTRASSVDVVSWQEDAAPIASAQRELLTGYLQAHGVTATLHWYGLAPRDVGDSLLSLTTDLGSDLLVMGCYGHSRAREFVLGGASRTVMRSMTVPTLMTH